MRLDGVKSDAAASGASFLSDTPSRADVTAHLVSPIGECASVSSSTRGQAAREVCVISQQPAVLIDQGNPKLT